jgi:hypothetical protein
VRVCPPSGRVESSSECVEAAKNARLERDPEQLAVLVVLAALPSQPGTVSATRPDSRGCRRVICDPGRPQVYAEPRPERAPRAPSGQTLRTERAAAIHLGYSRLHDFWFRLRPAS